MRQRIMLSLYGLIIAMAAFSTHAGAVALGKIDVASHLGEPFYAEVPLSLDEGEVISSVFVELAAPTDYRILEVYRDQALNIVRADVESDSRGSRVELTSRNVIDAPFFNLVLKVRYGRATHYKKYPVFLDLPRSASPNRESAALPSVSVEEAAAEAAAPTVTAIEAMPADASKPDVDSTQQTASFKPHDQWARTSHYGPMVYGDTISTVADRLRVDDRYTRNQVMVALFEKNRSKFEKDNINLIQAGTHLDVPMADEVERIAPDQAHSIVKDHNQRWRELVKQPRYAAVKEAQDTRYSKRVRVGKSATGVASAPVSEADSGKSAASSDEPATSPVTDMGEADGTAAAAEQAAQTETTTALVTSVTKLQKENEKLQARLAESEAKVSNLSAGGVSEAQTAADARIKKLELQLARLQAELDSAKQSEETGSAFGWITYLLGGLVIVLLGGVAFLMRRERQHPAAVAATDEAYPMDFEEPVDAKVEDVPEVDVEPVEDFSGDATEQMGAEEFEDAFTDSIPDLTEEETGEMEAFKGDEEDDPDPNVDYLSEADVYMRYGMEDEAEKQVEMALKLRENNKDAHVKLVQVRKAKGDDAGVDEALSTARMVLTGESLTNFESTITGLGDESGGSTSEEMNLDDTLPPGELDVSALEGDASIEEVAGELDDIDLSSATEESPDSDDAKATEEEESLELDALGDIDWPEETLEEGEAEAVEEPESDVASEEADEDDIAEAVETDGLDFDLSGLELPDEATAEPGSEAEPESEPEAVVEEEPDTEAADESSEEPAFEAVESIDDDDGLNLSDLDLSDEMMASVSDKPEGEFDQVDALDELGTADLDKTVVMDWSKETLTSDEQDIGSESGAEDLDIDFEDDVASVEKGDIEAPTTDEPVAEAEQPESEPEDHISSVEFDLEDLDVDLDGSMDSGELDDFSSTIQTSIDEIKEGVDSDSEDTSVEEKVDTIDLEVDGAVDDNLEFGLEPLDEEALEPAEGEISADGLGETSLDDLSGSGSLEDLLGDSDKDFDATMELDSLLSELGDLDEPEAEKKEDEDKKE